MSTTAQTCLLSGPGWEFLPGNLRLEAGAARLLIGGFVEDAPGASLDRDPTYAYLQGVLTY